MGNISSYKLPTKQEVSVTFMYTNQQFVTETVRQKEKKKTLDINRFKFVKSH